MISEHKVIHFIWLLPASEDANIHLRDMLAREALAVPSGEFLFFQATDYIKQMERLETPSLVVLFGSFYKLTVDMYALVWRIKQRSETRIAAWLTDDPYEFDVNYLLPKALDYVFSNDKNSCQYYHSKNVFHLPMAASEAVHVLPKLVEVKEWDFVFCGVGFPNRIALMRGIHDVLRQYSTIIIGSAWPEDILDGLTHQQHISYSELLLLYSRSKIVMNMARNLDLCNSRYEIVPSTPNPRVFEVAAMGVFQLTFYDRPELYEYFRPNEMITFDTRDEFASLAQKYLTATDARKHIAKEAQRRVISAHLYRHRLQRILEVVFGG